MNVLITREKEKYQKFADKLTAFGLTPFSLPMIECEPVPAIISGAYDYGVFTSLNAVKFFEQYKDKVSFEKVAAVGPATAEALLEIGIKTDIVPGEASSDGLKAYFSNTDVVNKKFLFPGAKKRAGDFHIWLAEQGAAVDSVTIYRTKPALYPAGYIDKFLNENSINVVTFASPSAAKAMLENTHEMTVQIVCIGRTTAEAVRKLGYDARYPDDFSLDWMVKLIKELA